MTKTIKLLALPVVLALAGAACGGEEKQVLVPAAEVAPRTTPLQAVEAIAQQRCDHEATCNAIGPSGKFVSTEQCLQAMRADASKELSGNDCIDGVADRTLNACLGEISARTCGGLSGSFDELKVHRACRTSSICLG